jgi:tetratricopeptide (TPR) repeat protein
MYMGEVLNKLNKLDEARDAYRQALDLRDRLAGRDPANFTRKDQLAESHAALAEVFREQNAWDDALQSYEYAVELVADLIENRPTRAIKYRGRAYDIYMSMGDIYDDAKKNAKEALKRYDSAANIAKPPAEQNNDPAWQGKLAWAYQRMGDELVALSDPAVAPPLRLRLRSPWRRQ